MDTFIIIVVLLIIIRPLNVLFHELGHAIPALLLTKEKVTIFIGSYGNREKGINFTMGLLEVWFIFNPITRHPGLCLLSAKNVSMGKQAVYIAMGPLTSLLVALVSIYIAYRVNSSNDTINFIFFILFFSSLIDFMVNIIPNDRPIMLYNGKTTHNDGYRLRQLIQRRRFPKEYAKAIELYNNKKYAEAASLFDEFLIDEIKDEQIYRFAIACHIKECNYNWAKTLSDKLISSPYVTSNDYCNAGLICSRLGQPSKAMEFYDRSMTLDEFNTYTLNNKGYELNAQEKYTEAIPLFNKVIEIDEKFAYSFNNRGLAKIKLGQIDDGLADIKHSITLDPDNSYCYLHLGIFSFDKQEYSEALAQFEKARQLDKSTYKVDEYISKTKLLLES